MITFKAIIIPNNRRKDGTYPVKIRVTFKGVSRRLPTTMVCRNQDLTRGNKIKNQDILSKADELINRMRCVARDISPFDLDNKDVDWVVSFIKDRLTEDNFHLDFFEWSETFLKTKKAQTAAPYKTAVNSFASFLGERKIDINDIKYAMILDFVDFVESQPKQWWDRREGVMRDSTKAKKPKTNAALMTSKLQHIYNAAKDRYNDEDSGRILIPKSPFSKVDKRISPCEGQKSIGHALMQKIISYDTQEPEMRASLDIFIVSFGLMGANLADLFAATPVKGLWIYNRIKTESRRADKAEMRVEVPSVLDPYIARLEKGKSKGYWFSLLHDMVDTTNNCTDLINRNLKKWCAEHNLPPFTFYAARHTWATIARKAGIEKATIDECLAHKGSFAITDIYAERNWELINEANRKVLDLFEW